MKKTDDVRHIAGILLLITFCALALCGCATYKFQKQEKPLVEGFTVSRDGYTILEYTLGAQDSLPQDMETARQRFSRRRRIVEHYYKKMGYIENHFTMTVWKPVIYTAKTLKGMARLPWVALSDYRYERNPRYRQMIDQREKEADELNDARIAALKDQLKGRLGKDIGPQDALAEVLPDKEAAIAREMAEISAGEDSKAAEEVIAPEPRDSAALIVAKPAKGYAPLRVRFSCRRPGNLSGKIVSYHWDFGDGETSTQATPANTYYSGSFKPKEFIVTLIVRDNLGNLATATTTIEVLNK